MKKISFLVLVLFSFLGGVNAAPTELLRVSSSAIIEDGYLEETVVLTDANGELFLEMPEALKVMYTDRRAAFSGEILSPVKTKSPAQSPKTRMKELYSFELVGDAGEELLFTDRISTLHPRNRLREVILNPDSVESGSRPKLLYVLQDESVRNPRLWRFISEEDGWERIGGIVMQSGEKKIFTAKIFLTGKYTLFDENPISTDSADDYKIEETIESLTSKIERYENQLLEMKRAAGLLEEDNEIFFEEQDSTADEDLFDSQEILEEIPSLEDPNQESQEFSEDDRIVPAFDPETGELLFPDEEEVGQNESLSSEAQSVVNADIEIPQNAELPQTGIESENSGASVWALIGGVFLCLIVGGIFAFRKSEY